jgi:hypothetical protein
MALFMAASGPLPFVDHLKDPVESAKAVDQTAVLHVDRMGSSTSHLFPSFHIDLAKKKEQIKNIRKE